MFTINNVQVIIIHSLFQPINSNKKSYLKNIFNNQIKCDNIFLKKN